jgi:hypothetical protein
MAKELENLKLQTILGTGDLSFSALENDLARKFNIPPEQFKKLLMESETNEEFLEKINAKEVINNE